MSDRRRFLKGLTSLPLATVLASPRLAAAVSAGLQRVEDKTKEFVAETEPKQKLRWPENF